MGPLRRQLILLLASASPALAEVCDKTRPRWAAADGPVSAPGELLVFATTPAALLLLAALAAGWYFRQQLLLSATMLACLVFIIPQKWPVNPDLLNAARGEGCIGPPTLVIGFLGLIWCLAAAGLMFRRKGGR
jgi:hypothetical protein